MSSVSKRNQVSPVDSDGTLAQEYAYRKDPRALADYIRSQIIGSNATFYGPFGNRTIRYFDYIASGKALRFIEDYITQKVLPHYANTHSATSSNSQQTTVYRNEARRIIRNSVNATEDDCVIFTGSGSTGAIKKLISILCLDSKVVTVITSTMEHHSNLLSWRSMKNANVLTVKQTNCGLIDIQHLESLLKRVPTDRILIGAFMACSNVTGLMNDDLTITALIHQHGGFSFWDYAASAPYVHVNMNPKVLGDFQGLCKKDALYISCHKFVGGVQTPGLLVVKKQLFHNKMPTIGGGGGTVVWVTNRDHEYSKDPEVFEEGGTPAIVESIRAGLAFQLKEAVGADYIVKREYHLVRLGMAKLANCDKILFLGNAKNLPSLHLPILSFLIKAPDGLTGYLHHNFACTLLNDLFGIQARGGCACAGPYAQYLLDFDEVTVNAFTRILEGGNNEVLKPGFNRLNLPWFSSDDEIQFVLEAIQFVAEKGWKFLPQYTFDSATSDWYHRSMQPLQGKKKLMDITYSNGMFVNKRPDSTHGSSQDFKMMLESADILALDAEAEASTTDRSLDNTFTQSHEKYRWFVLPEEARLLLTNPQEVENTKAPLFVPKKFENCPMQENFLQNGSQHSKANLKVSSKYLSFGTSKTFEDMNESIKSEAEKARGCCSWFWELF